MGSKPYADVAALPESRFEGVGKGMGARLVPGKGVKNARNVPGWSVSKVGAEVWVPPPSVPSAYRLVFGRRSPKNR